MEVVKYKRTRFVFVSAAIVFAVAFYIYPSFKAGGQLGAASIPPIFAPDLSMYLNLSQVTEISDGRVINPYYRVPVPRNGAGYLKFRLGPSLFGSLNVRLGNRTWCNMLLWNAIWWVLLGVVTIWLLGRFLPVRSIQLEILGLGMMMLFNFGVLKTLLLAWVHLPSVAQFSDLSLPFIRAFIPIIPAVLMLAYLGLQMEALRGKNFFVWVTMAALQLFALATFPYTTLMMALVTTISLLAQTQRLGLREAWRVPLVYGIACSLLDAAFLWQGSVGFYANRTSAIKFQPQLLPHLIGGNWALVVVLTVAVSFTSTLTFEVKWPLVALGAANALLMLGDAFVPSTTILLSHHAARFLHLTVAILGVFLTGPALATLHAKPWVSRSVIGILILMILLNGVFLVYGNYQAFLQQNREIVQLSDAQRAINPGNNDLIIARSKTVDDSCGWVVLLAPSPVLFCTDAQVMLTPQQNRDIHRFRQALYLYLTGEDSTGLQRALAAPNPSLKIWRLGFWAEAISQSPEEREQGVQAIQCDLLPWLERVENHDAEVISFFRRFRRIIVIDSRQNSTFAADRLGSFLTLEEKRNSEDLVLSFYAPKPAENPTPATGW